MSYKEQLESQNLELRDKLESTLYQNEKMAKELKSVRKCFDILYNGMKEFKNFGGKHDTNPTLSSFDVKSVLETYSEALTSQESYIKGTASDLVEEVDKYLSDVDVV